jgi:ribosomal-protein-alanine N-acetyltransferase
MPAEPLELQTPRLIVWRPELTDASRLQRYAVDNHHHLAPWSPPTPTDYLTREAVERRLEAENKAWSEGRSVRLAIAWGDDDERRVLGTVALTEIIRGPLQQAHLGYGLAERAQGKGVMTEALRSVCAWAFDELRLHRLSANYMPSNERSGAVLRRLDFAVVGYARDYLFINGAWRDHVLTQLIDPRSRPPA